MKLPKQYDLSQNAMDLTKSLAKNISDSKHDSRMSYAEHAIKSEHNSLVCLTFALLDIYTSNCLEKFSHAGKQPACTAEKR